MRKLKRAGNSSQSARNAEPRCFYTMELTNLISGCVTTWPAGTGDTSLSSRHLMSCERQSKYTVDETPDCNIAMSLIDLGSAILNEC